MRRSGGPLLRSSPLSGPLRVGPREGVGEQGVGARCSPEHARAGRDAGGRGVGMANGTAAGARRQDAARGRSHGRSGDHSASELGTAQRERPGLVWLWWVVALSAWQAVRGMAPQMLFPGWLDPIHPLQLPTFLSKSTPYYFFNLL